MKWGRKKSSLISHVFSASWLKKLKLKSSGRDEPGKCKAKQKDLTSCSSSVPGNWKQGRFYTGTNDLYWRLSFGEEKSRDSVVNPLWYDSDDELAAPVCSSSSRRSRTRSRDSSHGRVLKEKRSAMAEEKGLQSTEIQTKDEFPKSRAFKPRRHRSLSCPSYDFRAITEDPISKHIADSQNMKIKHTSSENAAPGRRKCRGKASRTAIKSECKIRALEEMKKAKKTKERRLIQCRTAFDSYAVVKSSYDPQQDFRDSMLEMIMEKGIQRPEELEELLVCYLNVNCGEYHDLIIKVFRQVWFELKQVNFGKNLQNGCSCHH